MATKSSFAANTASYRSETVLGIHRLFIILIPMRKRFRIGFAILLVAALGGLTWVVLRSPRPPNPVYGGKKLNQWLNEVDPKTRQLTVEAAAAIRQMGTNA